MTRAELLAELLAERFGPVTPPPAPAGAGGTDDEMTQARRRRVLRDALDDAPARPVRKIL